MLCYSYHTPTTAAISLPHIIILDCIHRRTNFTQVSWSNLNRLSTGGNSLAADSLQTTADLALGLEAAVGDDGSIKGRAQRLSLLLEVSSAGLDRVNETEGNGLRDVRFRRKWHSVRVVMGQGTLTSTMFSIWRRTAATG